MRIFRYQLSPETFGHTVVCVGTGLAIALSPI